MTPEEYRLLLHIDSPEDLKRLSAEELRAYCDELRRYIVDECSVNPGHLASSLGAVELAAALHYVFDTPADKIVWDVGHQTYAHKIITGRREAFKTKRRLGGISGFPRMSESEYDAFGGGHASVSISAAFGMAKAAELRGEKHRVVAVIGDGSMTGGLAFEGLNNAGASKRTNLLVILNDNNMAIDQATGALKNYLLKISTSVHYNRFKQRLWGILSHTPRLLRLCQKAGNAVKQGLLNKSNLFESLNFRYFGPVDGHNLKELVRTLRALRDIEGPKLLHVMTVKGKGYLPAEHNQPVWHAPGRFNPDTGERISSPGSASRYQDVFGETLVELAERDSRVVGVTPAMPSGCSMNLLMQAMPSRCFDVGIAEGHAVTFSAGLAAAGMVPFCNIYSTFMQRAYDNVIHDVAIQDLPVVMCLDRGGLVGEVTGCPGRVSYMLQKDLLLPYRTIEDNVALPLIVKGMKKREARELASPYFRQFGLEGTQKKYPSQLSGGMRQRAALLRTYLFSGSVALLDEPFSALDMMTKKSVHDWYLKVMDEIHLSTLFITHDIDEAILLSDRIYLLTGRPGRITEELIIEETKPRDRDFGLTAEFLEYKRHILKHLERTV